ncbi:MAG: Ferrous-iron efflux pump FieF [Deltaproteobacteria bacterium ADurb.BinA179]|jgi:cation diffusion facilitator family transporter|nr:MAG: Ferrous-iron efflux pump FieF [Deltaproteobacteria bacterium ADurb.BinA179]HOD71810.1 cation diffusion facilitator family transporter [Deltaproteobacteria bacterium]HQM21366.1 cation diffusion facilitator family transporter [Deltaproteobacteria bacterium]HRC96859.1 cation diffusion facilitator family transporter [Deltaproteobacteria bacterium]
MPWTKTQEAQGKRVTWAGVAVNTVLIAVKFSAGVFGHSQALIADAVHSVSDLFTDFVVLLGLKLGRKPPDESHHFGHGRIETMASAVVGFALIAVAVGIGLSAALDIYNHTERNPTWIAIAAAASSILVKEILYQYTVMVGRRIHSQAVIANAWHHRSDAFSSVAVLIGVTGAQLRPGWHILDAYAALLVSLFIVKVGIDVLWGALREFADTAPRPEVMDRIRECIQGVEGVRGVHDLRVRSTGGILEIQVHLEVDRTLSIAEGHFIINQAREYLRAHVEDIGEITVHLDPV